MTFPDYQHLFSGAVNWMDNHNQLIPPDLLDDLGNIGAIKTVGYYTRVLVRDIRRLYNGEINTNLFVDNLAGYVERQLRRAWNEGMRANGLDPAKDMTAAWEQIYQNAVVSEFAYIDNLAEAILEAKRNGTSIDPLIARAELWANRYTDLVNQALAETGKGNLFKWEFGATEEHCDDCLNRAGQVKTGQEWQDDILPQSHDLACGGWRCDCRLQPQEPFSG